MTVPPPALAHTSIVDWIAFALSVVASPFAPCAVIANVRFGITGSGGSWKPGSFAWSGLIIMDATQAAANNRESVNARVVFMEKLLTSASRDLPELGRRRVLGLAEGDEDGVDVRI